MADREIYRRQSLDKLASPERLDQLMRIVKPQSWVLVSTVAAGIVLVVVWGIVGRVPSTVEGVAVLVRPKQVVSFQSLTNGQIGEITAEVGELVERGALLAMLRQPELESEQQQAAAERALVERHNARTGELEQQLADREREHIRQQRQALDDRIERVRRAASSYRDRTQNYLREQRLNLESAKKLSTRLGAALEKRFVGVQKLFSEDKLAEFDLIEPESNLFDNRLRRAELELKSVELDLRLNQVEEYYDERMDVISDLEVERHRLEVLELEIDRRMLEKQLKNQRELARVEQRIELLRVRRENEGEVRSDYGGRVLEINVAVGQQVGLGQDLGKIEIDDPNAELKAVAYFSIKDGKRVNERDHIRVSPATVERERFVGIAGRVERVSKFPVTSDAATHQIGDREIARNLLGGEARIEVVAMLERDAGDPTSYLWTAGRGPSDVVITAGTTGVVRVTIEERAPITFVLPFLESLFEN